MVFHRHAAVGGADFVIRCVGRDFEDGVGGVRLLVEHRDDRSGVRRGEADGGGDRLENALFRGREIPVGCRNLHQVVEQLEPLGIVHVGGNLVADGIDVNLLIVQLLQDLHSLGGRLFAEVLADEVPHEIKLRLQRLSIGLDDRGTEDEETDEEAVPLLVGRVSARAASPVLVGRLLPGLLPGLLTVLLSAGPGRNLPGSVDSILKHRSGQVSQDSPDRPPDHPAEESHNPSCFYHDSKLFLNLNPDPFAVVMDGDGVAALNANDEIPLSKHARERALPGADLKPA